MLERGFMLPPAQFEAAFVSLAHTLDEINAFTAAAKEALTEISPPPESAVRSPQTDRTLGVMNFFGHAAVARHVDDGPEFVLGAMAPDLLAMCGVTGDFPASAGVAAGQAHHLAVDAAFHGSVAFVTLQAWAVGI